MEESSILSVAKFHIWKGENDIPYGYFGHSLKKIKRNNKINLLGKKISVRFVNTV
jgi:hypothetical protein